jgi:hypothetical protein
VLNSHPDIFCFPEVFNNRAAARERFSVEANYFNFAVNHLGGDPSKLVGRDDDEGLFLDFLEYLRCFTPKRFLLLDVKYSSTHHVTKAWRFITKEPHLFFLIRKHRLRVLNLQRRNYLRYCLSEMKAQATQRWTALDRPNQPDHADRTMAVDVDWLLKTMELCRADDEAVTRAFAGYRLCLRCDYDDLFEEIGAPMSETFLTRIADWLGLEAAFAETKPRYRKQSVLPLEETIANYEEVAEALRGTPFEYCLEDERIYRVSASA